MTRPTDYASSQWDGETMGTGPDGFARHLQYEQRSAVHARPPAAAISRSNAAPRYGGPPVHTLPEVLIRIEDGAVHFVGRPLQSTRQRSGRRTLLSVRAREYPGHRAFFRVIYRCDCGREDHARLEDWRKTVEGNSGGTQCRECAHKARRDSNSAACDSKAVREAKTMERLTTLPREGRGGYG